MFAEKWDKKEKEIQVKLDLLDLIIQTIMKREKTLDVQLDRLDKIVKELAKL